MTYYKWQTVYPNSYNSYDQWYLSSGNVVTNLTTPYSNSSKYVSTNRTFAGGPTATFEMLYDYTQYTIGRVNGVRVNVDCYANIPGLDGITVSFWDGSQWHNGIRDTLSNFSGKIVYDYFEISLADVSEYKVKIVVDDIDIGQTGDFLVYEIRLEVSYIPPTPSVYFTEVNTTENINYNGDFTFHAESGNSVTVTRTSSPGSQTIPYTSHNGPYWSYDQNDLITDWYEYETYATDGLGAISLSVTVFVIVVRDITYLSLDVIDASSGKLKYTFSKNNVGHGDVILSFDYYDNNSGEPTDKHTYSVLNPDNNPYVLDDFDGSPLLNGIIYYGYVYTRVLYNGTYYYGAPGAFGQHQVYLKPGPATPNTPSLLTYGYADAGRLRIMGTSGSYWGNGFKIISNNDGIKSTISDSLNQGADIDITITGLTDFVAHTISVVGYNIPNYEGEANAGDAVVFGTYGVLRKPNQPLASSDFSIIYEENGIYKNLSRDYNIPCVGIAVNNVDNEDLNGAIVKRFRLYDVESGEVAIAEVVIESNAKTSTTDLTVTENGTYYFEYEIENKYDLLDTYPDAGGIATSADRIPVRVAAGWQGIVCEVVNPSEVVNVPKDNIAEVANVEDSDIPDDYGQTG